MRAFCIGSATVDTIATIESARIERMSMLNAETSFLLLEEGRKTEALDISTHCGGGALNAAVALARLGYEVSALFKLGVDARAEIVLSRLTAEGISDNWVVRDREAPTGASVIISSHEHNAAVFTFRGANALFAPQDLATKAFAADLVYISALSGRSATLLPRVIEKARAAGALVALNAGLRQLATHSDALLASLAKVDLLALNRREAEALVPALTIKRGEGHPRPAAEIDESAPPLLIRGLSTGNATMSLPALFSTLHELGTSHVLLTDGAGGAFVGVRGDILHCPAAPSVVANTAGAGDAMAATFAGLVAEGHADDVALKAAALNAASVIAHIDTQSGLLRRDALKARIDADISLELRRWKL